MASDISLAVGDGARRMTYAELAAVRGVSALSAERLVRRKHWPRQVGNDGVVRVLVPLTEARKVGGNQRSARSGHPPLTSAAPAPDDRDDIREDVRALEEREKLAAERDRFRALAEERDRTIEEQQETIRHLRSLLADERRRMMALLTAPKRRPWWRWFR